MWDGRDFSDATVKAGDYFYRIEAALVRTAPDGDVDILGAVTTRFRTITAKQGSVRLFSPLKEPIAAVEIGSDLVAGIGDLAPETQYDIRIVSDGDLHATVATWRLSTDATGTVPPVVLWPGTGVVGCGPGGFEDPMHASSLFAFRDTESALAEMGNVRFFLEVAKGASVLSFSDIPLVPPTRSRVFSSDADGCLLRAPAAGVDDVYVTGVDLPAGAAVRVFVMPDRTDWVEGAELVDLRGEPTEVELGPTETSFRNLLLAAGDTYPHAFDIVTEFGEFMSPPVFPGAFEAGATIVSELIVQVGPLDFWRAIFPNRVLGLSRDLAAINTALIPPFGTLHRDAIPAGDDLWFRMIPAIRPEVEGTSAGVYVVDHRTAAEWSSNRTLSSADLAATITFGTGVDVAELLLVPGIGEGAFDVVVDLDGNGLYDGTDPIDRLGTTGVFAIPDPSAPGPFDGRVALVPYDLGTFAPPSFPGELVPLNGYFSYPAEPPPSSLFASELGVVPIIFFVHGNHDSSVDSAAGYIYLLEHLASWGYIGVSINMNPAIIQASPAAPGGIEMIIEHIQTFLSANPPSAALAGHVAGNKIGLVGHSEGGIAVKLVNEEMPVAAVATFAPDDGLTFAEPFPPYFNLSATSDCDLGYSTTMDAYLSHDRTSSDKGSVTLEGVGHNLFNSNWDFPEEPVCGAVVDETLFRDPEPPQHAARAYLLAFFDEYLRDESRFFPAVVGTIEPPGTVVRHIHEFRRSVFPLPSTALVSDFADLAGTTFLVSGVFAPLGGVPDAPGPRQDLGVLWSSPGSVELPFGPLDVRTFDVIAFVVSQCVPTLTINCPSGDSFNLLGEDKAFSAGLRDSNGLTAVVPIEPFGTVPSLANVRLPPQGDATGPVGIRTTIRIPLETFFLVEPALNFAEIEGFILEFGGPDDLLASPAVIRSAGVLVFDDIEFSR